jgi:hypothetical protein
MYEERLNLCMGCYKILSLSPLYLKEWTVHECLIWEAALELLVL